MEGRAASKVCMGVPVSESTEGLEFGLNFRALAG